jgi:hypothetical protein
MVASASLGDLSMALLHAVRVLMVFVNGDVVFGGHSSLRQHCHLRVLDHLSNVLRE